MAHFVPIPADREYWVPKLRELSLLDPNGTAALSVWGLPPNSTVEAEDNVGFVAQAYRKVGDLTSFYLRGLVAGDKIAVMQGTTQQTAWLLIKAVVGDHRAKQRAAGTLPRSRHKDTFILDPHGALQRHPPIAEDAWLEAIEREIATIRRNPIGMLITGSITKDVTFRPWIPAEQNANSGVVFSPQAFYGNTAPSSRPDEVLFHELCHVLENDFSGYTNNTTDGLDFSGSDFFTVTATNMYSRIAGRPLRADHATVNLMPALYANPTNGVATFKTNHAANFASVKARMPAVFRALGNSVSTWNPFR